LADWLFNHDLDEPAKGLTAAVLSIINDPGAARKKVAAARQFVAERHAAMMAELKKHLPG
jgi:hypothetical protein